MAVTATIVDYGCGNILSIANALQENNAKVIMTRDPKQILNASRLVLPGVGAFGHCIHTLRNTHLIETIKMFIQTGKPVLGICVGMQMLFTQSEEYGDHAGLDIFDGKVTRMSQSATLPLKKIPCIGWAKMKYAQSDVKIDKFAHFADQSFYFVHSYVARPKNEAQLIGYYEYFDEKITALVVKENVVGCQFHPEKSGQKGLQFLACFLEQ